MDSDDDNFEILIYRDHENARNEGEKDDESDMEYLVRMIKFLKG